MRILIADDNAPTRAVLDKMLGEMGECVLVANGEEAVQAFAKGLDEGKPFDLVCMDIMMPVKDGQIAIQEIRAMERERDVSPSRETKIFMLTALSDDRNVYDSFFKGEATCYITKPIKADVLKARIQEAFEI